MQVIASFGYCVHLVYAVIVYITYLIWKNLQDDKIFGVLEMSSSERQRLADLSSSVDSYYRPQASHEMGNLLNASLVVREGILWTPGGIGFAASGSQGELAV